MRAFIKYIISAAAVFFACASMAYDLDKIKLPEGFKIDIYADGVENARAMAFGDKGTLFAGSMGKGKVYAVTGKPGNTQVRVIASGLNMPVGVAFYNNDLYISSVDRIVKLENIESRLDSPGKPVLVSNAFPDDTWHGWKFIRFGPDNRLYVPVGAPCNVCARKDRRYSSIMRMNPDGSGPEVFASGIRNTVGFDWEPETGVLWFTDNGRDLMGDDIPPDELNRAPESGMHFGFPYMHGKGIKDPDYWAMGQKSGQYFTQPALELGPHAAALGMRFNTSDTFPEKYKNMVFIAEHGSWNRSKKNGYRITTAMIKNGKAFGYSVFAEGWKQGEKAWGRPVDVEFAPDGSLLVSDDKAGVIYRIYYEGNSASK